MSRKVFTDIAHHVAQRGNNQQDIFFVDDDRKVYLKLLQEQSKKYSLAVIGYCLMTNHVHVIAVPHKEDSLARAIGRTHFLYTQYINRFHGRSGHLWQGRFYSCALDNRHFLSAMRYIESNPVRARICRFPWKYRWSSALPHIDDSNHMGLLDLSRWYRIVDANQWKRLLIKRMDPIEIQRIRGNTHTGRPLGSDSFVSKLEKVLDCRLRPLPGGRPKKKRQ